MKKQTLMKILLILLPVLAVGLATTVDSVTVYDTVGGTTEYYSYFDPIPVENLQYLPSLAGLLSMISGILAAVYLGNRKTSLLKGAGYAAFGAAIAACIPIVIRSEILVVPNVALPIFMMAQYAVTYFAAKLPEEKTEKKKAQRLKRR